MSQKKEILPVDNCRNCGIKLFEFHKDELSMCWECRKISPAYMDVERVFKQLKRYYDYGIRTGMIKPTA